MPSSKKKKRRVVIISDLHCGAKAGLTPNGWMSPRGLCTGEVDWGAIQFDCWAWYGRQVRLLGVVDAVIVNGDAIDGKNVRNCGTELITSDRREQCDMAAECIRKIRLSEDGGIHIIRGTPYHTGDGEDWEDILGGVVGARSVGNHKFLTINGITLDCRHKVGTSTTPHGRHTPAAKERLWAQLWSVRHGTPESDIIIRSHVHYFSYCGGPDWLAMTTPSLQSVGNQYGARQCSGLVDYGFISIDIDTDGSYQWRPHLAYIGAMAPKETVVF